MWRRSRGPSHYARVSSADFLYRHSISKVLSSQFLMRSSVLQAEQVHVKRPAQGIELKWESSMHMCADLLHQHRNRSTFCRR